MDRIFSHSITQTDSASIMKPNSLIDKMDLLNEVRGKAHIINLKLKLLNLLLYHLTHTDAPLITYCGLFPFVQGEFCILLVEKYNYNVHGPECITEF